MSGQRSSGRQESEESGSTATSRSCSASCGSCLPGVQVLFAFLLVVPFNQRFGDVSAFQKYLYLGTLLCAAAASACLIAPSIHHRIAFRHRTRSTSWRAPTG